MSSPTVAQFEGFTIRKIGAGAGINTAAAGVGEFGVIPNLGPLPATKYGTGSVVIAYVAISQMVAVSFPGSFDITVVIAVPSGQHQWGHTTIASAAELNESSRVIYADASPVLVGSPSVMLVPTGSTMRMFVSLPINLTFSMDVYGWTI